MLQSLTLNLSKNNIESDCLNHDTNIKTLFKEHDAAEMNCNLNWTHRFRLDALQLQQRVIVCEDIKSIVFEKISDLTKGLSYQEQRFAPIKEMSRAMVKLSE